MIRGLITLLLLTLSASVASADVYKTKFNPFTGKPDYVNTVFIGVPASPTDACTQNTIAEDDQYLYICVGTNQWMRTTLTIWTISENWLIVEPNTYLLVEPGTYLRTQ